MFGTVHLTGLAPACATMPAHTGLRTPRELQEMTLAVHDTTLVPTLPQMADALMAVGKLLRIHAVQPPHTWHEISFRRFDEHVIMLVHQTIRVASPPVLVDLPPQDGEKPIAVDRIEKDNLPGIAPGRQMIPGTPETPRVRDAPWSTSLEPVQYVMRYRLQATRTATGPIREILIDIFAIN